MVSVLVFVLIVIVVLALFCWLVSIAPFPGPQASMFKWVIYAILVVIAAVLILDRVGVLSGGT